MNFSITGSAFASAEAGLGDGAAFEIKRDEAKKNFLFESAVTH